MNYSEMLKFLEHHGYHLVFLDDGNWCFWNEYLSSDDEFLLDGIHGKDKMVVIEHGYSKLKQHRNY